MQEARFVAISPFEIGDKINVDGVVKTITDIACVHFVKDGVVNWYYQLNDEQEYLYEDQLVVGRDHLN